MRVFNIKLGILIFYIGIFIFLLGCTNFSSKRNILESFLLKAGNQSNILKNIYKKDINFLKKFSDKCCFFDYGNYYILKYIIKPGDTLYYIACITGNNYLDLARDNDITDVNLLKVGQVLNVRCSKKFLCFNSFLINKNDSGCFYQKIKNIPVVFKKNFLIIYGKLYLFFNSYFFKNMNCDQNLLNNFFYKNVWYWPTHGVVINDFSISERENKGIDIVGQFGQPIVATTNGQVVYVGNKLKGYGNLIIIKHKNNYFSTYAHNNFIFVNEQQIVKAGEKIATMGNSDSNEVKLYFEIRYKGKSVNPFYYLPVRN